jgi:hypothetical protein
VKTLRDGKLNPSSASPLFAVAGVLVRFDHVARLIACKVERSGIFETVEGHVLIYVHKEEALADVERRYPADHYVMVDDKLRILSALKKAWGDRVTTVFARQGKFAHDPRTRATCPPPDLTVNRIDELLDVELAVLLRAGRTTGADMPEITDWKWGGHAKAARGARSTEADNV